MKGDYIYCLNPACNKLSIDNHNILDSRNNKLRVMCPFCKGTNTTNANVAITAKQRCQLILKTKKLSKAVVKEYAEKLKSEGILKRYQIKSNKNSRVIYLYDMTNIKDDIMKQAKEQEVKIFKIENFK